MRVYRLAAVACVLCVASAARADVRNVVSKITVTDGAGGAQVRIVGTRAPSFTQFTLQGPQRVVIDLSGTVLAGPAAEVPGDGHLVRSIRTAMFESRDVSVARVTLEFARPVTYAMHADGTDLVVSLQGAAGTEAVADAAPVPAGSVAGTEAARVAAEHARDVASKRADQAAAELTQARAALAQAQTDRQAAERRAAEETARAKAAEAARQAAVAQLHARQQQAAQTRTQADHAALARAQAAQKIAEAQAAREAKARSDAEAKATALAAARAQAEAKAAAAEKQAAAAEAEVARLRSQGRVVADAQTGVEPGQRYALAEYQQGGAMEGTGPAVAPGAPKVMELVGFRQKDKVSQVFIKTNEPARYSVNEQDGAVVVEIENTQARTRNDLNYLDTRFFDSAVSRVDPQEVEGAGTHIEIRIELKEKVPYEVKQVDNEIQIDFRRPAS